MRLYSKTTKMLRTYQCPNCGEVFRPNTPGQKFCEGCSPFLKGLNLRKFDSIYKRLKAAADASGNPKIWTSKDYSQEFLRSLIPR